jgi:transcriptional regulator with XRE-family HTH domain
MDEGRLGEQFRALRLAAGRTVASVAMDAGLSVPYIANLENGRGNPTVGALSRLAAALGRRLELRLSEATAAAAATSAVAVRGADNSKKRSPVPASLSRFARTERFRRTAAMMAQASGSDTAELSARLLGGLTAAAGALGRDLTDADWARLLDALFLIYAHPESE